MGGVKPWQRMRRITPIPQHLIEAQRRTTGDRLREVWSNGTYEVFVYYTPGDYGEGSMGVQPQIGKRGVVWLSIKRMDREAVHDWRHFQQIKNEVVGEEREAIELYPRESRLADNANQYHLWVAPEGADWPVGFESGMTLIRPDEVEAFNDAPHPGRQRPMQPGLTIGRRIDNARLPEHDEAVREMLGIPREEA